MAELSFTHTISTENYNDLRRSVDFITIRPKRAKIALEQSLFILVAMDGPTPAGMARVVGDGG